VTAACTRRLCAALAALAALAGCAGVTSIQKTHPLIATGATLEKTRVYFMRPDPGFQGVMDFPLAVVLGGTELMKLAKGSYTLLTLESGSAALKLEYYAVAGPSNRMTSVSTTAQLHLAPGRTEYLVFELVSRGAPSGPSFVPRQVSRERALDLAQGLLPVGGAIADPLVR
jgi:hypothetical protein